MLFGGCLILAGERVGNRADADLEGWPRAIEALRELEVDYVVPGHGERSDPGLLEHSLGLLRGAE